MAQVVIFADAVTVLRTRLADGGVTAPISGSVPNPRPAEFVVIRRVGGVERDMVVDRAVVTIEAWASTPEAAHDLLQISRAVLHSLPRTQTETNPVYMVDEIAGPAYLPDLETPDDPHHLYRMTAQVSVRGSVSSLP